MDFALLLSARLLFWWPKSSWTPFVGGRVVFALGDLRLPFPIPERAADLDGVLLGFSGMGGQYDLEGALNYQMWDMNWSFQYKGVSFSGEAEYGVDQFLNPLVDPASPPSNPTLLGPVRRQVRLREELYGYYAQAAFPLARKPPFGKRFTGVLVYNQMYRRGPALDFLLNYPDGTTVYPSLTAYRAGATQVQTQIDKYTGALNYDLTEHFALKFDYSYWVMRKATLATATSLGYHNIYQGAFSLVMGF